MRFLIPNIPFIEFDFITLEEFAKLVLERCFAMMFLLEQA
jgi:hypothetical protein